MFTIGANMVGTTDSFTQDSNRQIDRFKTGNGTLTLNPGTAQESAISISTLFPDTNSTSTTTSDFANLYGNNPGTLAAGLDAQTALNGETSFTGEAYRTFY